MSKEVTDGEDLTEQIKAALNKLLDFQKPKNFKPDSKDNVLIIMDKSYHKTLFAFSENNIQNSDKFSMFEYRTAIEMLKERNDKMKAENDNLKNR